MNASTLTIRLPREQRAALRRTAAALKMTESQYIRELLARDMDSVPFGERVGELAGSLDSSGVAVGNEDSFREAIHRNNRRPA